jgi:biopolymer transport protein ExbD
MAGSDKIKGFSERLITVPGYHIHPQYDMVHTRHLIHERRSKKKGFTLSLAPMVDMFSILTIYLLMNFSSEGDAFFISQQIEMPKATHGVRMRSLPLISVVKGKLLFDAEKIPGEQPFTVEEVNDEKVPQLRQTLQRLKRLEEQIGNPPEQRGQVNIQADIDTPMSDIKNVMRVLSEEGWTGTNFVVVPLVGSE